ncbi:MAG: glycosyltransferase family 39 protein, partial [Lentisphaeria bacterium]|nr:glycosyltransferase family 39 protein [Lentisphaeria bacterium]
MISIFKQKYSTLQEFFCKPMSCKALIWHFLILLFAAVLLRIFSAIPALSEATSLLRPDSMGYWNPALALAAGDGFVSGIGSTVPEVIRPVGYPAFLAFSIKLFGNSLLAAAFMGIICSASAVVPVVLGVRKMCSDRAGVLAGWLYAVSISSVAAAPLILSDTLLGTVAAWQFCLTIYFVKERQLRYLAGVVLFAIAGALIKPVNLPVVLCGIPVILVAGWRNMQNFLAGAVITVFFTGAILLPYLHRNYQLCGDFDGNSANLYFHNGSAILAYATGESSEVWKNRLLQKAESEFKLNPEKYPTLREQNAWKKKEFALLIKKHPAASVITHLPNIFNLLPDMPSFLENNHITTGERGTMAVLRQKGFFAAVNHYLN